MTDVSLARVRARYRLRRGEAATRERLDRILADVLGPPLEHALAARGVGGGELCLRRVEAPVRLRLAATDAALTEAWAGALADGIAGRLAASDPDVVRYGSRAAALVDACSSAVRGELARAWAWRRIGIWTGGEDEGGTEPARAIAAALCGEPACVGAVVAEAARGGWLSGLAALLGGNELTRVAEAGLAAAGVSADVLALAVERLGSRRGEAASPDEQAAAVVRAAAERVAGGVAGRALARAALSEEQRVAAAALAVLASEPALLAAGGEAAELLAAVAAALERLEVTAEPATPSPGAAASQRPGEGSAPLDERSPGLRAGAGADEPLPDPPPSPSGRTSEGGLLFLLGVVDELRLPERLVRRGPLAARPLPWTLHRLALTLRDVEPDDPAALALAGLAPGSEPPSEAEPAPTPRERAALAATARRVVARVRERLAVPDEEPDEDVLAFVCARPAEIVADPGWLEARFAAEDASTEIRLAGLDLDPGWLPWLGTVVRFAYV